MAALALAICAPLEAAAAPDGSAALALIKRTEAKLRVASGNAKSPVAAHRAIAAEVRGVFDMGELARHCMGKHAATMTAAQRSELTALLGAIVEHRYARSIRAGLARPIRYLPVTRRGSDVLVRTEITEARRGRTTTARIDYRVAKRPAGLRIVDVVTDTVSLSANYRALFNRIIRKRGVTGLLGKLRKKAKPIRKLRVESR